MGSIPARSFSSPFDIYDSQTRKPEDARGDELIHLDYRLVPRRGGLGMEKKVVYPQSDKEKKFIGRYYSRVSATHTLLLVSRNMPAILPCEIVMMGT